MEESSIRNAACVGVIAASAIFKYSYYSVGQVLRK